MPAEVTHGMADCVFDAGSRMTARFLLPGRFNAFSDSHDAYFRQISHAIIFISITG